MSRELDPKAAANEIRDPVFHQPEIPVEARHMHAFVVLVCGELGIEPDPINFMAVTKALHDADIKPHQMQEYPKMLCENGKPVRWEGPDSPIVIFESAEDEAEYHAGLKESPNEGEAEEDEGENGPKPRNESGSVG